MAEENSVVDTSVEAASLAIAELLKQPAPSDAAPEEAKIQPEAAAPQAQASEANPAEDVQAPDSANPQPESPQTQGQPEPQVTKPAQPDSQAVEKAIQDANAARDQLMAKANALSALIPTLEAAVKGEFADIKTQEDLWRIGQTDPERYNRFVLANAQIQQAKTAEEAAKAELQNGQRQQFEQWQKGEMEKLDKLIPDLRDPQKGPGLAKSLHEFAVKQGYTQQQLTMASASDFAILHKAMLFDGLEAAKATAAAKAAKAPPVQKPGTAPQANKDDKLREGFERLQKTGSVHDAAALMRNLI